MVHSAQGDALSDVFDQVEVRGLMTGGFAVRGSWTSHGTIRRPLKLVALVAGSARIVVDGPGGPIGPVELGPGDVVLLNHRTHLEVRGGVGDGPPAEFVPDARFDSMALAAADLSKDDVLVGGWIQVNPAGQALFRTALPGLVHVRASAPAADRLATLVAQLFREASSERLGSAFAIRQNAQLILLEVLRAYLEQERPPVGWFRLLADEPLAPALRLMHDHPGRSWGLAELARAAGMSRTTFAERFRSVAGIPPLAYLSRWRMLLAQRALRDPDVRVGALAAELGYGSESAFSTAFKRAVGVSPAHWRRRSSEQTGDAPAPAIAAG
ncbi:AraC family transcriptional regulator [Curtobacterium sp. MCBD17_003]|uniref:helix-turn-helix transcriptional regulator n=1 Tax=Curtobacterium sp. MCBD17_003 TaxID=2175667 RepID=UPI000DAA9AE3|nr:AraC family transcriptional regulator [Curtobacterium sp. MCBD17_003]WIE55898.1 AraC family transcriptional regulator [Curtobacterium sp. MCBD17_003]